MKKYILTIIVQFIVYSGLYGQNIYNGIIINKKKSLDKVEYLITLENLKDSTKYYTSISKKDNSFIFINVVKGNYYRCVSEVESNISIICDYINIPFSKGKDSIIIDINTTRVLDEVIITAKIKVPLIKYEAGVLQVNVEGNPIFSTGTVFETLSKMPGVSYDAVNNSFRLNGKSGILIQSDDRTLYLTGNELIEYLKTISAGDISKIEINSAPSSKYEASGGSGIINIKTKRIKREGIYIGAMITATQGRFFDETNALKIQYNTKKDRFLLYYNSSFNKDFEEAKTVRRFFGQNNSFQDTYAIINGNSNNIRGEYEREFKNSKLILSSKVSIYKETIPQNTTLDFFSSFSQVADSTNISFNNSNNKLRNYSFGADYYLTKKKNNLTLKVNYLNYEINNNSLLKSFNSPSNFIYPDLENHSPNKINIFLSEIDYVYKIDSLSKIELGSKAVYQNLKNENNFFSITNGNRVFDIDKSNEYSYREWVIGLYVQYYRKLYSKIDLTLGARLETNPSKGESKINNFILERKLTNFFPYVNISYSYNKNNNFNLSYNKRITRPVFSNLLPYTYFVDPFTRLTGNPELNPFISQQLQFQYILKQKYIFGISYTLNENQIFQTPFIDSQSFESSLKPINIEKGNSLAISSNLNFKILKWWDISVNNVLFYDKIKSNSDLLFVNSENWSTQFTTTNQIKLPKKYVLTFTTDYISSFIQGPYKTDVIFSLNASISKSFFNNSFYASITANDILNTYEITNTLNNANDYIRINQNFDIRWIRLSLTYKFRKGINKSSSINDKSIDEIKKRIK